MVSPTIEFWNRLNYEYKSILYRLVNGTCVRPSERFLDRWWFSLNLYTRESIIDDLVSVKEMLKENDK